MAEENKTESAPAEQAQDSKAEKKEVAALKKRVSELEANVKALTEVHELDTKLIAEGKKLAEELSASRVEFVKEKVVVPIDVGVGSAVVYAGKLCEITHAETTWEIGQLEAKGLVEEDQIALVLRKL